MWPFISRRSLQQSGFFRGFTDWHCHILPGVDDGVREMDESLRILSVYERLGIATVWLTPHIMEDMPNTTTHLRRRFDELRSAWHGGVELRLGSENMLDNLFQERLEARDLLPIGERGDHLLVETSLFSPPLDLYGTLKRIKSEGYHPVLAHPERYDYMGEREYRKLREMDVRFQISVTSLAGMYGKQVRSKARRLYLANGRDLLGTDLHRHTQLAPLLRAKTSIKTN